MHDRKRISIIRIIRQGKLLKKIPLWADANALSCINTAPVTLPYENMHMSTRNSIHTNTDLHLCHFISWKYTTAWHYAMFCLVNWSMSVLWEFITIFSSSWKELLSFSERMGLLLSAYENRAALTFAAIYFSFPVHLSAPFNKEELFASQEVSGSSQFCWLACTMYI